MNACTSISILRRSSRLALTTKRAFARLDLTALRSMFARRSANFTLPASVLMGKHAKKPTPVGQQTLSSPRSRLSGIPRRSPKNRESCEKMQKEKRKGSERSSGVAKAEVKVEVEVEDAEEVDGMGVDMVGVAAEVVGSKDGNEGEVTIDYLGENVAPKRGSSGIFKRVNTMVGTEADMKRCETF
ncbi:hypothetical protein G7Y89_g11183 [Cudoniella acicularis]|uniref:Uncharacterized protein n=1 Tax=Cudoniella acicularis TaxID=354080 RepID=A0A8H4RDL7_9HELO|nr:hypothetical protein G7Y89_g11183 [Cudoniella acicularis]